MIFRLAIICFLYAVTFGEVLKLRRVSSLVVSLHIILTLVSSRFTYGLNIALHAQVKPDDKEKIVGSVITTDGLRRAFLTRPYAENVTIFYPSEYDGFFDVEWDYIIIEGWFPSIQDFLLLTRNYVPSVKIVFYCLDPTYPGLDTILHLDLDGIMTNSQVVLQRLKQEQIPGSMHLLAADTEIMRPFPNVTREIASIYVGAAGHMLVVKPSLKTMLMDAKTFGLHLYGTGWGSVPEVSDVWRGTLPRYDLAQAYARAQVVLASTIQSQDEFGMVNNRIFEALSCGAIILSEYSDTLFSEFGDLVYYYNASYPMAVQLQRLMGQSEEESSQHRHRARQFIEQYHTWLHRIVDMENFLFNLGNANSHLKHIHSANSKQISRRNALRVLVITSNRLVNHIDKVSIVDGFLFPYLQYQGMKISLEISESELTAMTDVPFDVTTFHVILAICAAFDPVDQFMQRLPASILVQPSAFSTKIDPIQSKVPKDSTMANAVVQRRLMFMFGSNVPNMLKCWQQHQQPPESQTVAIDCANFHHYDTIFYRSMVEVDFIKTMFPASLPSQRLQHMMGVDLPRHNANTTSNHITVDHVIESDQQKKHNFVTAIFVCFWEHRSLCSYQQHQQDFVNYQNRFMTEHLQELRYRGKIMQKRLLLVGGALLADWIMQSEPIAVYTKDLSDVIHWAEGSKCRNDVLQLFPDAFLAHFYLPETYSVWSSFTTLTSESAISSTDFANYLLQLSPEQLSKLDTSSDVVSLLAATAVVSARVHLADYHYHYLRIANKESPDLWDYQTQLTTMMRNGINRLFGLPPARSNIVVEHVPLIWDPQQQEWKVASNPAADADAIATTQNQQDQQFFAQSTIQSYLKDMFLDRPFIVLRLGVTGGAVIGRDMLLCMSPRYLTSPLNNKSDEDSMTEGEQSEDFAWISDDDDENGLICLLRPMLYVVIVDDRLSNDRINVNTSLVKMTAATLWFMLRGNMFSNYLQHVSLELSFPLPPLSTGATGKSPRHLERSRLLPSPNDNILVYSYR